MATNARWKHPDGAGGYTVLNLPSSAEIVSYGTGTVKDELDNLSASTGTSAFIRSLLQTNDAYEARALLGVAREDFFDEAGGRWNASCVSLDSSAKKFGSKSAYFNGSSWLKPAGALKLGGKDFTISFWAYIDATNTAVMWAATFYDTSSNTTGIGFAVNASNKARIIYANTGTTTIDSTSSSTPTFTAGTWHHLEADYRQSDNTLFFFFDGTLLISATAPNLSTEKYYANSYLGYNHKATSNSFKGYIDEFFVTEKLLHTANFTPPTDSYTADDDTILLLHFD